MLKPSSGDRSWKAWPISATSWLEGDGRDDEDGGVDEQRQHQRDGGIERRPFDGVALAGFGARIGAGLHDGGVQVEIVRHDRGADDADGDIKHGRVGDDLGRRHEQAMQDRAGRRRCGEDLHGETAEDDDEQGDDEGFEIAEALVHQQQHQEGVERGDQRAADQRDAEQKVERDGGADDLGEVAGDHGEFAGHPQGVGDGLGIIGAAGLGEVAAGGDAEAGGQRLQEDRHQVGQHDDEKQRVAELGAASEVGGPVAGIHIADGDHVARAHEGEQPAEPDAGGWHGDGGIDLRQARPGIAHRPEELPAGG